MVTVNGRQYPTLHECRPGHWVELTNGWIVGPIVQDPDINCICVEFAGGTWQLMAMGQPCVTEHSTRLIARVGTRAEILQSAAPW